MNRKLIADQLTVPAREGRGVRLRGGDRLAVVDLEGQQVGDVFAFASDDLTEYHSAAHTRSIVDRLFPALGECFATNRRRPILRLIEDTSPGLHDMLIPACDTARYVGLGAGEDHASCANNLHQVMAGLELEVDWVPQPINVFMNIQVMKSGKLTWEPAASRSGDRIVFEALMDCVFVLSACPQDIVPINGPGPSPLAIELLSD